MHPEVLAVSWLGNRVLFASFVRGELRAAWESSGELDEIGTDPGRLRELFIEGARQTGYKGRDVFVVLDHSSFTQHLLETPPAKGRDLELYVGRQVDQLKTDEQEVVWSFQATRPIKSSNGLMVYLFSKPLHDGLVAACRTANLHLMMIVAPTVILAGLLPEMPIESEETALLAAETGSTIAMVIGRREGPIFYSRSLRSTWQSEPERIGAQIRRSGMFLRQQFDVLYDRVWMIGQSEGPLSEAVQTEIGNPVSCRGDAASPTWWVERLARLSPESEANLISRDSRSGPRRKKMARITAGALGLALLTSLGVAGWVESRIRQERTVASSLQPRLKLLEARKKELEDGFAELARKREVIKQMEEGRVPPIPGWFLSYVADVLPDDLVLFKLEITRPDELAELANSKGKKKSGPPKEEGLWKVRLEGGATEEAIRSAPPVEIQVAFAEFAKELTNGPFHLEVENRTRQFVPGEFRAGGLTVAGLSGREPNQFFIEGILREPTPNP